MADTRELRLKLTIDAPDPSKPSKAYQDIAAQASKLSLAAQDANRQMQKLQGPAALSNGTGAGAGSMNWTRPGFTGRPESISWTRPGFTGAAAPSYTAPSLATIAAPSIASQVAASAIRGHQQGTSTVSAFDRPQSVVIVGPRPLPVTMMGGMPGATSGVPGVPGGAKANPAAPVGGGLGGAAAALATIATTAAAFGNLTEAIAQASQPTTTAADRFTLLSQAMAKSVPIIGDSLASIVGSLQNAAGRLTDWKGSLARDKYRAEFPGAMAKDAIESRGRDQLDALNRSTRQSKFALEAREQFPSLAYQVEKQSSGLGGSIMKAAWENKDVRVRGSEEAVQTARRSLAEADAAATAAKVDVSRQRRRTADAVESAGNATLGREAADRRAEVGGAGGAAKKPSSLEQWAGALVPGLGLAGLPFGRGPYAEVGKQQVAKDDRAQQLLVEQRAITQALKEQERLMAAQERSGQAIAEAAKKRHELSKAETDLMRSRLDVMKEEQSKIVDARRSFGALDSVSQQGILADLKTFKELGREGLTEGSFSRLQSVAPDLVAKQLDERTKDSPLTKEFISQLGLQDEKTLETQIQKLQTEMNVKVEVDAKEFQKVMADEMERLNNSLSGMIRKIVASEINLDKIQRQAGQAGN
jgi:hypothetical protein